MGAFVTRFVVLIGVCLAAVCLVAAPSNASPADTSGSTVHLVTHYKGGKTTVTNNSTVTVSLRVTMVDSYDWYDGHAPNDPSPQGFQGARLAPGQSVSVELGVWIEANSAPFRLTFLTNPNDTSSQVGSAEVIDKRVGVDIRGWGLDRTTQTFNAAQADQSVAGKRVPGKSYQVRVQCGLGTGDQTAITLSSHTP